MDTSIDLIHNNLKSQEKSLLILNSTAGNIQSLNFPIANSIGVDFNLRVYVNGTENLWHDRNEKNNLLIGHNTDYAKFVKDYIGKIPKGTIVAYWRLFRCLNNYGFDHQMLIKSSVSNIDFDDTKALGFDGNFISSADVYFNYKELYFETKMGYVNGIISSNSKNSKNFADFINSDSYLYLKIRYPHDRQYILPIGKNKKRVVTINHIEISSVEKMGYGIGLQNVLIPQVTLFSCQEKANIIKTIWGEDVPNDELWRYDVVKIPIRNN